MKPNEILNESGGISSQDLADVLFRRLEARYPDIVSNHGHEVVGDAVSDVASFHAGAEELGSSDIGIMLREILKQIEERAHPIDEARQEKSPFELGFDSAAWNHSDGSGDLCPYPDHDPRAKEWAEGYQTWHDEVGAYEDPSEMSNEDIEDESDDSFNLFNRGRERTMDPNSIDRTKDQQDDIHASKTKKSGVRKAWDWAKSLGEEEVIDEQDWSTLPGKGTLSHMKPDEKSFDYDTWKNTPVKPGTDVVSVLAAMGEPMVADWMQDGGYGSVRDGIIDMANDKRIKWNTRIIDKVLKQWGVSRRSQPLDEDGRHSAVRQAAVTALQKLGLRTDAIKIGRIKNGSIAVKIELMNRHGRNMSRDKATVATVANALAAAGHNAIKIANSHTEAGQWGNYSETPTVTYYFKDSQQVDEAPFEIEEDRYTDAWAKKKAAANKATQQSYKAAQKAAQQAHWAKIDAEKKAKVEKFLSMLARDIERYVGEVFPDADPYEFMAKKYKSMHERGDLMKYLDLAARKVLGAKNYNDYLKDFYQQQADDSPELWGHLGGKNNPFNESEGMSIEDMVMDQHHNGNDVREIAQYLNISEEEVQSIIDKSQTNEGMSDEKYAAKVKNTLTTGKPFNGGVLKRLPGGGMTVNFVQKPEVGDYVAYRNPNGAAARLAGVIQEIIPGRKGRVAIIKHISTERNKRKAYYDQCALKDISVLKKKADRDPEDVAFSDSIKEDVIDEARNQVTPERYAELLEIYIKLIKDVALVDELDIREQYDRGLEDDMMDKLAALGVSEQEAEYIYTKFRPTPLEKAFKDRYGMTSTQMIAKKAEQDMAKLPPKIREVLQFLEDRYRIYKVSPHMMTTGDGFRITPWRGFVKVSHWDGPDRKYNDAILKSLGAKFTMNDMIAFAKYFDTYKAGQMNESTGRPRVRKYTKTRPDGTIMTRYEVLDHKGYRIPGQGSEGFDDASTAKKFLRAKEFDIMATRESKSSILNGILLIK